MQGTGEEACGAARDEVRGAGVGAGLEEGKGPPVLFAPFHSYCRHADLSPVISGLNFFSDFGIVLPVCTLLNLPVAVHTRT